MNEVFISKEELNTQDVMKKEAISLVELQEQKDELEKEIDRRKEAIKKTMEAFSLKKISFFNGHTISYVERRNVNVDKKKAETYLDSLGVKEQYMKLDDTLVKKTYYKPDSNTTYDFIQVDEPTTYIQIKGAK